MMNPQPEFHAWKKRFIDERKHAPNIYDAWCAALSTNAGEAADCDVCHCNPDRCDPHDCGNAHPPAAVQSQCLTCSGHGLVGGLLPGIGGYDSQDCPDCKGSGVEVAAVHGQSASTEGAVAFQIHEEDSTRIHATLFAPVLKEFCLEATRDDEGRNWYIEVSDEGGYHTYDGYWRDSTGKTRAEVLAEAVSGSLLDEISAPPEGATPLASPPAAIPAAPAEAMRESLKWCAAALQAIALPGSSTVRLTESGEAKTMNEVLDLADAALAQSAPVPSPTPKRVTPEMRKAFRDAYREGGFWADRLDYALDRMIEAAPVQQEAAGSEFPFYELRFIMRVLGSKGEAPRQDWDTACGMARKVFAAWHSKAVQEVSADPLHRTLCTKPDACSECDRIAALQPTQGAKGGAS